MSISPSSPRTQLSQTLADIYKQHEQEAKVCSAIDGILEETALEFDQTQKKDVFLRMETSLLTKGIERLRKSEEERTETYNQIFGILLERYIRKGWEIEKLADSVFGLDNSPKKMAFIEQNERLAQTVIQLQKDWLLEKEKLESKESQN